MFSATHGSQKNNNPKGNNNNNGFVDANKTTNSSNNNIHFSFVPPPTEVNASPKRRTFTLEYKRDILLQVDSCTSKGGIGEILRREGLYSSHILLWRKQLQKHNDLVSVKRGPKPKITTLTEINQLRNQLFQTEEKLRRANIIIDAQKKMAALAELWGMMSLSEVN